MSPMIRTLCLLLAFCLAATHLSAQGAKMDGKIEFSVTRFDPLDRPPPEFMVKNGAQMTPVKVPLTYIAGPFSATLRDDKYLDFFEPGAKVPILTTVIAPDLRKNLLLVFVPGKESFEILKIRTPPSSIKGGDHYVINATETDVAIKFGTAAPVVISPRRAALLHDPSAGNTPTLPVVIKQKAGDEWKLVTTENWPHDSRFRTFLFLYASLRDHHMAFHGITERVD